MISHKLVLIGPVGAGKTTAINTLSGSDTVSTDVKASDITGNRKQTTTVALDYGQLTLGDQHHIRFYGAPGQYRFNFMWDVLTSDLAHDANKCILLLDNTRNQPQRDLTFYIDEFSQLIQRTGLLIGVTQSDIRSEPSLAHYQAWIDELGIQADIHFFDARSRQSVLSLVQHALTDRIASDCWTPLLEQSQDMPILASSPDGTPQEPPLLMVNDYLGDKLIMKDSIVDDVMTIKGVEGAVLANDMGDVLTSSLDDPLLEEYIGFMAGMIPAFHATTQFDPAKSILIKSPKGSSINVFIEEDQVLGIIANQRTSARMLKQQVEDMLQWT